MTRHCERAKHHSAREERMDCFAPPPLSRNDAKRKKNHDAYDDNYIRSILNGVKSIAWSAPHGHVLPTTSPQISARAARHNSAIRPLGKNLSEKPFVASCRFGRPVDMIDIFRNSIHIMCLCRRGLTLSPAESDMDQSARATTVREKAKRPVSRW